MQQLLIWTKTWQ